MRTTTLPTLATAVLLALLPGRALGLVQSGPDGRPPKPPPDEFKALLEEVREAYKAPLEVDEDVLDELRKQYKDPSPKREEKIFREIRRLYATTPELEQAILAEVRRAYEARSPEQEDRLFDVIRRAPRLPPGTVPPALQAERSARLFQRLDRDESGVLIADEMTDALRGQAGQWDRNGDRAIDAGEYAAYYEAGLRAVGEKVASGEIQIKLPKGATVASVLQQAPPEERPAVTPAKRPAGLPAWFGEFDADGDSQVGLYEWRMRGRPTADFLRMDRNGDCYVTPAELASFLEAQPPEPSRGPKRFGDR